MPAVKESLFVILGNQLFPTHYLKGHEDDLFFMAENRDFCLSNTYHQHKLTFYLSAMRHYARELRHDDYNLVYFELDETKGFAYEEILLKVLRESGLKKISMFEIESKEQETKIKEFCAANKLKLEFIPSPGFLVSRKEFKKMITKGQPPAFRAFYEQQRIERKILIEKNQQPMGGRFIIDDEEKLKWTPKKSGSPKFPASPHDEIDMAVIQLVDNEFPDNPGMARAFWYPTCRESARATLQDFCKYRLAEYGVYETAICPNEDFLFHSVLAPLLNVGLLTPQEVIDAVLAHAKENPVPLNSLEAFIRQILGSREYMHGIYQLFADQHLAKREHKNHGRILNRNWREAKTGVPPLDDSIEKAARLAYSHHAERAMVLNNMMRLAEIDNYEIERWFTEMHMDSAEWALVPNVHGLPAQNWNLWSSKDWLKVSSYEQGPWCDEVDGLYWRFVDRHKEMLSQIPALAKLPSALDEIPPERREQLWRAADGFLERNTIAP